MEVAIFLIFFFFIAWLLGKSNEPVNKVVVEPATVSKVNDNLISSIVVKFNSTGAYTATIKRLDTNEYASVKRESKPYEKNEIIKLTDNQLEKFTWRKHIDKYTTLTVTHIYRGLNGKYCAIAKNGEKYFKYKRSSSSKAFVIGEKFQVKFEETLTNHYTFAQVSEDIDKWINEYDFCLIYHNLGELDGKYWIIAEYKNKYVVLSNTVDVWSKLENEYWTLRSTLENYTYYNLSLCESIFGIQVSRVQKEKSLDWGRNSDEAYSKFLKTALENEEHINYDLLRSYSIRSLRQFNNDYRGELFNSLNSGIAVLSNDGQTDMYNNSYGKMHKGKLLQAYNSIPDTNISGNFSIIDYGCGQGIGTLILLEKLSNSMNLKKVGSIYLIEPSSSALTRAVETLSAFKLQNDLNYNIISINKYMNNVQYEDILHTSDLCIHIFSNIIDIPDVDNDHLLEIISKSNILSKRELFVCVGPKFTESGNDFRSLKFKKFASCLDGNEISRNFTNIGKWTRQHIIVEKK